MVQNMNCNKKSMLLYAITDRSWLNGESIENQVLEALKGGITFLQLREKSLTENAFLSEALKVKQIAKEYDVPFVINDNIDIAIKCDADGVHVGQSDMNALNVRELLGKDKIIGVSAGTVEEAIMAEKSGADYIGVGAIFDTSTKKDAKLVSYEMLKKICNSVSVPVVAIGGISCSNILKLSGSGIDGVAVISAIFASKNITKATKELLELSREMIKSEC